MRGPGKILAVDDQAENLDLIERHLAAGGYQSVRAEDGSVALRKLEEDENIDLIVVDKVMPNLDGMDFLRLVKADARFKEIPVLMLTAAPAEGEAAQGIRAGLRYHLSKPFDGAMLLGVVNVALQDLRNQRILAEKVRGANDGLRLMQEARFNFRTLDDAANLACNIATCFPEPDMAAIGLHELLVNAVEHGNLGIGYSEKNELLKNRRWTEEVERRLALPENLEKFASLTFKATEDAIVVDIEDNGQGFDWRPYLHFSPERAADLNGRGIATSRVVSFPNLEYLGRGNVARCAVPLEQDVKPAL
jgi:CheY-like chemotaxis protein